MIYALGQCKCKLFVVQQQEDPLLVGTGKQGLFLSVKIEPLILRSVEKPPKNQLRLKLFNVL